MARGRATNLATTGFTAGFTVFVMSMGVVTPFTPSWIDPSASVTAADSAATREADRPKHRVGKG